MRNIVIGGLVVGALVLAGCDDKPSGGGAGAPSASAAAAPAASASTTTTAASASAKPAEPEKKKAEGPKDHKARAKSLGEAWASHDVKKVGALYTENAIIKRPGRPELKGREAIEKRAGENFAAFKDVSLTTGRVWEKDKHTAVVEWVIKGTDTGEWPEIGIAKATNKPFGVVGASLVEVDDDGFIKEEHQFLDGPTLVGQVKDEKKGIRGIVAAPPDGTDHFESATAKLNEKDDKKDDKKEEKKDDKAKPELAKAAEAEKKNLEVEDKFIEHLNGGKIDEALKLVADDVKIVDYTQEKDLASKKAYKEMFGVWLKAFPELKTKSQAAFADGDFVIEEREVTGVQKGALMGIKASNKPVSVHQLEIDQFKDGKFVKAWVFGNNTELFEQIAEKKEEKKEEKKK